MLQEYLGTRECEQIVNYTLRSNARTSNNVDSLSAIYTFTIQNE